MAPARLRKFVVQRDHESEESSEEEDEEDEVAEEEDEVIEEEGEVIKEEEDDEEKVRSKETSTKRKKPITISLKSAKLCKVCKAKDHQAGFVGSIYVDCPNRPCYLCKRPGHTTATCPHRVATEHGVSPAPCKHSLGMLDFIVERQLRSKVLPIRPNPVIPNSVESAVIKLHSRRVTSLEFHPSKDDTVLSGDKKGQVAIWNFEKTYENTVYETVHSCIVNSIRFHPKNDENIYTSSSDGTICVTDLETGLPQTMLDLNPDGWTGPATWRMIYGMDLNSKRDLLLAGDNFGFLYQIDLRTKKRCGEHLLVHKKGTKVVCLDTNPIDSDIFMTCGNDHMAKIWDMRMLDNKKLLAELPHPRVVNSAYFSPISGNKILTTCQDNRIRVWDCIYSDLSVPSREIVHSHDFNRYLTCFRAEWDPKDHRECLIVIGRYISDDFGGQALHPIDFIDASTGQLVAEVVDPSITLISPVNKLHPRRDILASGSSRSLFIWKPSDVDKDSETNIKPAVPTYEVGVNGKKKKGKRKYDNDKDDHDNDDDDEGWIGKSKKNSKFVKCSQGKSKSKS